MIEVKMKSNLKILPLIAAAAIVASMAASCSRDRKQDTDHSQLPDEVKPVAMAIIDDKPETFAANINYPISRPYPLHDIRDSAQMVDYYPTLVDDSLRNVVQESPDSLWQQDGWRGWTLDPGSYLWIDGGMVYSIDYVSRRETHMLDSLRHAEIESLDPSMRKGWTPVICIVDTVSGALFRIDANDSVQPPLYRLAGYKSGTDLSGAPTLTLYGNLDEEGSMSNRFYHFRDSIGDSAEYTPDQVDDSVPTMQINRKGKIKTYVVKPAYWLDHLRLHERIHAADSLNTVAAHIEE